MYLSDGIGIEITFETADRFDHVIAEGTPVLVGTDGHRQGRSNRSPWSRSSTPSPP